MAIKLVFKVFVEEVIMVNGMVLFAFSVVAVASRIIIIFVCVTTVRYCMFVLCFTGFTFYSCLSNRFLGNYSRMRDVLYGIRNESSTRMYQKYL